MTTNRISRNWLLCIAGSLALAGFAFLLTQDISAQGKGKAKTEGGDKSEKKEPKLAPPPTTFPKRVDSIAGGQGIGTHVSLIDEQILKMWKENKTFPSDRCTDHEFIRRASLDIIGRIPTVLEINRYMREDPDKRRSWLINAMLDGKEYDNGEQFAKNFADLWSIHLITRTGSNQHHKDQLHEWLKYQFMGIATNDRPRGKKEKTPSESTGSGEEKKTKPKTDTSKPSNPDWSAIARQLISAEGETNANRPVNYLLHNLGEEIKLEKDKNGKWDMVPATSRTTKLFLGIRTQCVQCHDHPFNGEWGQHHFWGMNAFLRQSDSNGRPNPDAVKKKKVKGKMGNQEFDLNDNKGFNSTGLVGYERRNGVYLFIDPMFLDGRKIPKGYTGTRREKLAEYITTSPWFAKAFVNRTWGHFFGKSFTKDNPDDFGDHNPVSHPELFDKLSEDWAKNYGHNPKTLIRWICNSQAYGLSSRANKWNDKTDDETLFARMLLKPMTPEQMFESMMIATASKLNKANKEEKLAAREKWFEKLIVNFGNDEGDEGTYTGTVVQALLLMNGQDINAAISDPKDGIVAEIVGRRGASQKSLPAAVQDMYMHALNRPATPREIQEFAKDKTFRFVRPNAAQPNANPTQFWTNYYQDIMWALLNSNEFVLNH